jgi:hypothetical protein
MLWLIPSCEFWRKSLLLVLWLLYSLQSNIHSFSIIKTKNCMSCVVKDQNYAACLWDKFELVLESWKFARPDLYWLQHWFESSGWKFFFEQERFQYFAFKLFVGVTIELFFRNYFTWWIIGLKVCIKSFRRHFWMFLWIELIMEKQKISEMYEYSFKIYCAINSVYEFHTKIMASINLVVKI